MLLAKRIISWLLFLLALWFLLWLGFWQLDRSEQKQRLLDTQSAQRGATPVSVDELLSSAQKQLTPLMLQGEWWPQWSFYLDNRIQDGRVGYNVFSLFMDTSSVAVLVDRGWLPLPPGKRESIFPAVNSQQIKVIGYSYVPGEYRVVKLPDIEKMSVIPLPGLNLSQLADFFKSKKIKLAPFVLRQTFPEYEQGLLREWQIVSMLPEKHFAYAMQWFAMAGVFFMLVVLVVKRSRKELGDHEREQ